MPINFSNTNTVWASVLVETLHRLGATTAIICPGSRSAPLAIAFAQHEHIEAIPVLDERSAAFFALGIARRSHRPTILVCTSGTAGANFYPAIIEARESRVPLLVLTADRPPELRDCNAGQAIDQQKLYGAFPNWYSELAVPALEGELLAYLRQTILHAWERSLYPIPGPVHLNLPFRDPLAPIPQPAAQDFANSFDADRFFSHLSANSKFKIQNSPNSQQPTPLEWFTTSRGIIIAGPAQPRSPQTYCEVIAHCAKTLGFPVLAEGLSPLRNYAHLNPYLICTYDLLLRNRSWIEALTPDVVIRIGEMPTSKELRTWLAATQPNQWIVDASDRNLDPLHGKTVHLHWSVEDLAAAVAASNHPVSDRHYCQLWCDLDAKLRHQIDRTFSNMDTLLEPKVVWLLSQSLPVGTPLFIANSMPVRDVEWFWRPGDRAIQPCFNRGANGIDGTLSTALGMAHRAQSSVLLTGDLALLHDTNGFLISQQWTGHLTVVVINNNGGGIFEMLPISQFEPPFEQFFATPQAVKLSKLCAAYGVAYEQIVDWEQLQQRLGTLPDNGLRVLEIITDRRADAEWRQRYFNQLRLQPG
jgi:2-succinyl-5-enolpyruvyl-6-hydroxy-3-cyclohexene-1-carboxylate synthase